MRRRPETVDLRVIAVEIGAELMRVAPVALAVRGKVVRGVFVEDARAVGVCEQEQAPPVIAAQRARGDLLAATGPDIIGAILDRKLLGKLVPLNRYEQRALARRRFAIQEFDRAGRNERRRAKNNVDFLGNEAKE